MSALIYGQPGSGKTTLACSAPRAVLFDFDGGVSRINGAHQIDTVGVISIPELIVDGQPTGNNDFFVRVIKAYHARLKKNKEETTRYERLCDTIKQSASEIENAEDANKFVEWIKETEHIYNSKAVALTALQAKAKALNLIYDKIKKQYA